MTAATPGAGGRSREAEETMLTGAGRRLWDALPAKRRGGWAATSAELLPMLEAALKSGDTVLVKGSNGARMALIVEALKARES